MKTRLLYPGNNSLVEFELEKHESIKAESGAMVAMSATVDVEGKIEGGFMAGLGRMLAGEKFFFQTLKANRGPGKVLLAPATPGDVAFLELDGTVEYNVQKDGFLAGSDTINVSTQVQNLAQGFLSGEGFFILRISGRGSLVISSFGAIHEVELKPGEEYVVDNYHLVAWPNTTHYTIEKSSSGWISTFTSGEMVVCRFRGPGKIYIQSRQTTAFGEWVRNLMGVTQNNTTSGVGIVGDVLGNIFD